MADDFDFEFFPLEDDVGGEASYGGKGDNGSRTFFKNLAKSVKGFGLDLVQDYLPNTLSLKDEITSVSDTLKDETEKTYKAVLKDTIGREELLGGKSGTDLFKEGAATVKKYKDTLVKNIKSGKLLGEYDDDEFSLDNSDMFGEIDISDGVDEPSSSGDDAGVASGIRDSGVQSAIMATSIVSGKENTSAIVDTTLRSSLSQNAMNKKISDRNIKVGMKQHSEVVTLMLDATENLQKISRYNAELGQKDVLSALEFRAKSLALMQDQISILKEIKAATVISNEQSNDYYSGGYEEQRKGFNDGMFSGEGWGKGLIDRIKNAALMTTVGGGLYGMNQQMKMQKEFNMGGDPIQDRFKDLFKTGFRKLLTTETIERLEQTNSRIGNTFNLLNSKFKDAKRSGNRAMGLAGDILYEDETADISRGRNGIVAGKKAVFDQVFYSAVTQVIPSQLSKMIAFMSGQEETMFDYSTGSFKTTSQMKQNFLMEKERVYSGSYALNDTQQLMNQAANILVDDVNSGHDLDKVEIKKGFEQIKRNLIDNGERFNDKNLDNEAYFKMLTKNVDNPGQVVDLFRASFNNLGAQERSQFNNALVEQFRARNKFYKDELNFNSQSTTHAYALNDIIFSELEQSKKNKLEQEIENAKAGDSTTRDAIRRNREFEILMERRLAGERVGLVGDVDAMGEVESSGSAYGARNVERTQLTTLVDIYNLLLNGIVVYPRNFDPKNPPKHIFEGMKKQKQQIKHQENLDKAKKESEEKDKEQYIQTMLENIKHQRGMKKVLSAKNGSNPVDTFLNKVMDIYTSGANYVEFGEVSPDGDGTSKLTKEDLDRTELDNHASKTAGELGDLVDGIYKKAKTTKAGKAIFDNFAKQKAKLVKKYGKDSENYKKHMEPLIAKYRKKYEDGKDKVKEKLEKGKKKIDTFKNEKQKMDFLFKEGKKIPAMKESIVLAEKQYKELLEIHGEDIDKVKESMAPTLKFINEKMGFFSSGEFTKKSTEYKEKVTNKLKEWTGIENYDKFAEEIGWKLNEEKYKENLSQAEYEDTIGKKTKAEDEARLEDELNKETMQEIASGGKGAKVKTPMFSSSAPKYTAEPKYQQPVTSKVDLSPIKKPLSDLSNSVSSLNGAINKLGNSFGKDSGSLVTLKELTHLIDKSVFNVSISGVNGKLFDEMGKAISKYTSFSDGKGGLGMSRSERREYLKHLRKQDPVLYNKLHKENWFIKGMALGGKTIGTVANTPLKFTRAVADTIGGRENYNKLSNKELKQIGVKVINRNKGWYEKDGVMVNKFGRKISNNIIGNAASTFGSVVSAPFGLAKNTVKGAWNMMTRKKDKDRKGIVGKALSGAASVANAPMKALRYTTDKIGGRRNLDKLSPEQVKELGYKLIDKQKRIYEDRHGKLVNKYGRSVSNNILTTALSTTKSAFGFVPGLARQGGKGLWAGAKGLGKGAVALGGYAKNTFSKDDEKKTIVGKALSGAASVVNAPMKGIRYASDKLGGRLNLDKLSPEDLKAMGFELIDANKKIYRNPAGKMVNKYNRTISNNMITTALSTGKSVVGFAPALIRQGGKGLWAGAKGIGNLAKGIGKPALSGVAGAAAGAMSGGAKGLFGMKKVKEGLKPYDTKLGIYENEQGELVDRKGKKISEKRLNRLTNDKSTIENIGEEAEEKGKGFFGFLKKKAKDIKKKSGGFFKFGKGKDESTSTVESSGVSSDIDKSGPKVTVDEFHTIMVREMLRLTGHFIEGEGGNRPKSKWDIFKDALGMTGRGLKAVGSGIGTASRFIGKGIGGLFGKGKKKLEDYEEEHGPIGDKIKEGGSSFLSSSKEQLAKIKDKLNSNIQELQEMKKKNKPIHEITGFAEKKETNMQNRDDGQIQEGSFMDYVRDKKEDTKMDFYNTVKEEIVKIREILEDLKDIGGSRRGGGSDNKQNKEKKKGGFLSTVGNTVAGVGGLVLGGGAAMVGNQMFRSGQDVAEGLTMEDASLSERGGHILGGGGTGNIDRDGNFIDSEVNRTSAIDLSGKNNTLARSVDNLNSAGNIIRGGMNTMKFGKNLAMKGAQTGKNAIGSTKVATKLGSFLGKFFANKHVQKKVGKRAGKTITKIIMQQFRIGVKKLGKKALFKTLGSIMKKLLSWQVSLVIAVKNFLTGMAQTRRNFNLPEGAKPTVMMRIASGIGQVVTYLCAGLLDGGWIANKIYTFFQSDEMKEARNSARIFGEQRASLMGVEYKRLQEWETRTLWERFGGKRRSAATLGFGTDKKTSIPAFEAWAENIYKPVDQMYKESLASYKGEGYDVERLIPSSPEEKEAQMTFRESFIESIRSMMSKSKYLTQYYPGNVGNDSAVVEDIADKPKIEDESKVEKPENIPDIGEDGIPEPASSDPSILPKPTSTPQKENVFNPNTGAVESRKISDVTKNKDDKYKNIQKKTKVNAPLPTPTGKLVESPLVTGAKNTNKVALESLTVLKGMHAEQKRHNVKSETFYSDAVKLLQGLLQVVAETSQGGNRQSDLSSFDQQLSSFEMISR